ncbi:MAG: hypothetical protein HRT51_00300 [Colwellia sp.]|nr:hypothetical protein [Colwellia sp.]
METSNVEQSNFHLDEDATRVLIDQQLNDAGWEVDTVNIRYSKGSKPERNKNEEIAARIIDFIRQAAIGEALLPFENRVDNALDKILSRQQWETPQKQWLQAIAKQMKATTIVDNVALYSGIFKQQLGGIKRANKLFQQPITELLADFYRALWAS